MEKKLNNYGLYVSLDDNGLYHFYNEGYAMELYLRREHIKEFIKNGRSNFYYNDKNGMSSSNSIKLNDIKDIKSYLSRINTYKTVSTCVRYSKQDKLKDNLKEFNTPELYEYIVKKNKNKSIVLI